MLGNFSELVRRYVITVTLNRESIDKNANWGFAPTEVFRVLPLSVIVERSTR